MVLTRTKAFELNKETNITTTEKIYITIMRLPAIVLAHRFL